MVEARNVIIYLAIKFKGNWNNIYNELKERSVTDEEIENANLDFSKINAITIIDNDYPKALKSIDKPPFVLFYEGNKNLLNSKKRLTVIGQDNMSTYGKLCNEKIFSDLDKDTTIITDTNEDIIGKSINNNLNLVISLNKGIDSSNYSFMEQFVINHGGLIISELPKSVSVDTDIIYSRVIAGLGTCSLLVESSFKDTVAYKTASFAAIFGRNVACIPSSILEESRCNQLLKEGAYLVTCAQDLKDLY